MCFGLVEDLEHADVAQLVGTVDLACDPLEELEATLIVFIGVESRAWVQLAGVGVAGDLCARGAMQVEYDV